MGARSSQPAFRGHKDVLRDMCMLTPDALVTASVDGYVKIWDVRSRRCKHSINQRCPAQSLCIPNDHTFVVGMADGMIRVWDMIEQVCRVAVQAHRYHAHALAVLNSSRFASCALDCSMAVWSLETGEKIHAMPITKFPSEDLCVLDSGLLISDIDGTMVSWDANTFAELGRFPEIKSTVLGMAAVSPTEFVSCGNLGYVRLWDARARASARSFEGFTRHARCICTVGDTMIASGGEDCEIRMWDLGTGRCVYTEDWPKRHSKRGHSYYVDSIVAMSPTSLAYSMNGVGPVNIMDIGQLCACALTQ